MSSAPGAARRALPKREKCENAERAVRKAIDASKKLNGKTIEVFAQGSYANRTSVRQDSDVDICVLYKDAFFPDYSLSQGLSGAALGFQGRPISVCGIRERRPRCPHVVFRGPTPSPAATKPLTFTPIPTA